MLEKCCGRERCNINAKCDYKLQFEECMKLTELIEFKIAVVVLWEYKMQQIYLVKMIMWCKGYFIFSTEGTRQSNSSFLFQYFNDLDTILKTDDKALLIKYTIYSLEKLHYKCIKVENYIHIHNIGKKVM